VPKKSGVGIGFAFALSPTDVCKEQTMRKHGMQIYWPTSDMVSGEGSRATART